MKILFDHQIFSSQKYGGVSKYFAEMIRCLPPDSWRTTAWLSNNEYARHNGLFRRVGFPGPDFRGKGRVMAEIGKPFSMLRMLSGGYDVVHQTNFDTYLFPYIRKHPMVTTYHDTNFVTERNYNERMKELQTKSLERADAIVAISYNTKCDMLRYFNVDESKIHVVHHGIRFPDPLLEPDSSPIDAPYILYVGNRHLFKNFTRFIEAFGHIAEHYPGLKVVCTNSGFTAGELELFGRLGISSRMEVVKADEETLSRLYRHAMFFVFPSLYEGFGMPILEAMANGCPTAIANASCFPEIAADATFYFDPHETDDIAGALTRMIDDEALRDSLREKGLLRAREFSWQKCADKHLEIYKSLS